MKTLLELAKRGTAALPRRAAASVEDRGGGGAVTPQPAEPTEAKRPHAQAAASAAVLLHALPPRRGRAGAARRGETRRAGSVGAGARRAQAGGLRPGRSTPSTSPRSCWCASTRPGLAHLRRDLREAQPGGTAPEDAGRLPESLRRLLKELERRERRPRPALLRRLPRSNASATCGGCWRAPGSRCTRSAAASCGCSSSRRRWGARPPRPAGTITWRSRSDAARCAWAGGLSARSTSPAGRGRWPPASSRASWPPARRWTCRCTWGRSPRSRRPGRWSGRRCASSRRRACRSSGAAPSLPRRRSPSRT